MKNFTLVDPAELRGVRKGERCVLLANGPSVLDADLSLIDCPIIGINRSWKAIQGQYHYAGDMAHFREISARQWTPNFLFTTQRRWDRFVPPSATFPGCFLQTLPKASPPRFSADLTEGVHIHGASTVALQIAVWMGFNPIFFVGLDLSWLPTMGHFYDKASAPNLPSGSMPVKQNDFFMAAAPMLADLGVEVINLNPDSACVVWPRQPFREAFPPLGYDPGRYGRGDPD